MSGAMRMVFFLALLGLGAGLPHGKAHAESTLRELQKRLAAVGNKTPSEVPPGVLTSVRYLLDVAERIERSFPEQSAAWRARSERYLRAAERGIDPYALEKGQITNRGYRSAASVRLQGYAIYLPSDYDPSRSYPLYVALHGGSSNGNLFLGVVLGNNMPWKQYKKHLWDSYTPRWSPDFIVVAPDGFGQVMWRWMGEQDVLDVIADVQRHYNVDSERIVLGGLSNGGVGAYAIGTRHAWRFSVVQAMAGAPSWVQYTGGSPRPEEQTALERYSALHLSENTFNTTFRYYHGRTDGGPMRPAYVEAFEAHIAKIDAPAVGTWYETGHDILYLVHRHGRVYSELAPLVRDKRPTEVRVVTGDYRASRQHWVTVTRLDRYPQLGRVRASAREHSMQVETDNVRAFCLTMADAPVAENGDFRLEVDGEEVFRGSVAWLGDRAHIVRGNAGWRLGFPEEGSGELHKRPGLSGPMTDAYRERMVHVYGTADPQHEQLLRRAAERGAKGWPLWLWNFEQEVVADTDVDTELAESAHLVLYGTAKDNAVLSRLWKQLPIRVDDGAVVVGSHRFPGDDVGVRFIYPNPIAPGRYVLIQAGVTPSAVKAGHRLPDFLPDYVVYDGRTTRIRSRLVFGGNRPLALGYFDRRWRLPSDATEKGTLPGQGSDPSIEAPVKSTLEVPPAPEVVAPTRFRAPWSDPAGRAARTIARRVRSYKNYRATIPGATWEVDAKAVWAIRREKQCLGALEKSGVPFRPLSDYPSVVPTAVELLGPVDGVWVLSSHEDRPLVVACEMALRLKTLVRVARSHGIRGIEVMSDFRPRPLASFHTMGLGLDLSRFWTAKGWLSVQEHFVETPDHETCKAPEPPDVPGRTLLRLACALAETRAFSSVLTPNYNEGHRDHFHLDARPQDPRVFVR